mgnify:CR=1 FL=1
MPERESLGFGKQRQAPPVSHETPMYQKRRDTLLEAAIIRRRLAGALRGACLTGASGCSLLPEPQSRGGADSVCGRRSSQEKHNQAIYGTMFGSSCQ